MSEKTSVNATVNDSLRSKDLLFPLSAGQVLVTGIGVYEKDGRKSFTLQGITPFEDYQIEAGAYGLTVVSEWTNRVDLGFLNAGDVVTLQYGKGFQGKAVLINCTKVGEIKGSLTL